MTPKQQRFVQEYGKDLNATQAAIRAGYSAKTAYSSGQRTLKIVEVQKAIAAGQARSRKRCEVTIDTMSAQLDEDRDFARDKEAPGAAISASMGKAKLHGLLVDRHAGPDGEPLSFSVKLVKPKK